MKNKKGYTLIELLAALVILGIITGMSFPVLTAIRNRNEKKKYEMYGETLISAAKLYVDAYEEDLDLSNGESADIFYEQLMQKKLIKDINIAGITCYSERTFVHVKKINNKYQYTYNLACGPTNDETGKKLEDFSNYTYSYFNNKRIDENGEEINEPMTAADYDRKMNLSKDNKKPIIIDPPEPDSTKQKQMIESELADFKTGSKRVKVTINAKDVYNIDNKDNSQLYFCVSTNETSCLNGGPYYKMNFDRDIEEQGNGKTTNYKLYKITDFLYNTAHAYNGDNFNIYIYVKDSAGNISDVVIKNYEIYKCRQPKPDVLYGDANGDKIINEEDYTLIQRHDLDMAKISDDNLAAADVDLDGEITSLDVVVLQRYLSNQATSKIPWQYGEGQAGLEREKICNGTQ